MARLTIAISEDVISRALDRAEPVFRQAATEGSLHAAPLDLFEAAAADAWNRLRTLVEDSVRVGAVAVQAEVERFVAFVAETAATLGKRGEEFRRWILAKVRELIAGTFDGLLALLRTDIIVGTRSYVLETVSMEHKVVYSGSLKASLTELVQFSGGGEFVLTGSYRVSDVKD